MDEHLNEQIYNRSREERADMAIRDIIKIIIKKSRYDNWVVPLEFEVVGKFNDIKESLEKHGFKL